MKLTRVIIVTLILAMALGLVGCIAVNPPAPAAPEPIPAVPESELALHEAYKAIETRLDRMAMNGEAQRYLADFMDLTEGMWQIDYVQEYQIYYVRVQEIRDSNPNTYYYKSYWQDVMWVLDSSGSVSPEANARRVEADLRKLSEGGVIEANPNYSP